MKKIGLLVTVLCVLSMLCVTAFAAPEENAPVNEDDIVTRALGDVDDDGNVTASDARLILRYAVELESFTAENIIYADTDFNNSITAADARIALRTSVELEERQEYAFVIIEKTDADCINDGWVSAKCQLTDKEVSLNNRAYGHSLPENFLCLSEAECKVCKEIIVNSKISHDFVTDEKNSTRTCKRCGFSETIVHKHKFSGGKCACGITAKAALGDFMNKYVKKNGTYLGDGYYYTEQYVDSLAYAMFYDSTRDFSYAYCGFAVEESGVIIYYDFNFDFEENMVELMMYTEDMGLAYVYGSINPSKVDESANGDAITIKEFDALSEFNGLKNEFRMMMEGAVYDSVVWLRSYCDDAGFDFTKEAFADFTKVYNYRQ
ncbi:MAG: dockerin type I repeat-containing protein [Clostridia bacterium]|nr:dockerin type I repeat-containing protein [Clostridia bacterium]